MFERFYRQRLEEDLVRWQAEGLIPSASAQAIRRNLPPISPGITIATMIGIVGGLLIAAAFLAFVAANWTEIARPARFAILIAGIAGAYGIGAWFDRTNRDYLADLSVGVGSIVFGAAIALVGQMYHLGDDFAGGLFLWAAGALVAAALTGSRSALAVALAAACVWSGARVTELSDAHLPFIGFWLIAAALAVWWNAAVARHLVAVAALVWSVETAVGLAEGPKFNPTVPAIVCASVLLGAGLALASDLGKTFRAFGLTISTYGSFGLAGATAIHVAGGFDRTHSTFSAVLIALGIVAAILAGVAAVLQRKAGPALAALSIALAVIMAADLSWPVGRGEPWHVYALGLGAMLSLVVSGMLDDVRPRVVAGWLGLAGAIAAITWAVRGSLLRRAVFLAAAGLVSIVLASALGRLLGKEQRP
jgi:uncharacterized membrane protein